MILALAGLRASDYNPDDEDVLDGRHSAACSAFSLRPTNCYDITQGQTRRQSTPCSDNTVSACATAFVLGVSPLPQKLHENDSL